MKDARGNTMVKGDGERYLIKDDRAMKTHRKEIAAELGENPKKLYPYWSPATLSYFFDLKHGDDPRDGPCKENKVIAFTTIQGAYSTLTLCPVAFNGCRLRSVAASALPSSLSKNNKPPSDNSNVQAVSEVVPAGWVAYHELLHLFWGLVMNQCDNEEYNFLRMAGKKPRKDRTMYTKSLAIKNPENYALAAVAYDYTLHVTHITKQGRTYPVEFYRLLYV